MDSSAYGFVEFDLAGALSYLNPAMAAMLHRTAGEALGRHYSEFVQSSQHDRARSEVERLLGGGSSHPEDYGLLLPDGTVHPVEISAKPIMRGGQPAGLRCVVVDIAERVRISRSLHDSEERHRRLIENLGSGYFFFSHGTDGVFTYVSPSVEQVLGFTPAEFCRHFTQYLTDCPGNEEGKRRTALSIQGVQQPCYEIETYCRDGSIRRLEVTEVPIRDRQGTVVVVEGLAHDVTARRLAEEQAQTQNRHDQLRAGIWRLAADTTITEDVLVRQALTMAGPALRVSRACFNRVRGERIRCEVEWCAPGVRPTLGTVGPSFVAECVAGAGLAIVTSEEALQAVPPEKRQEARDTIGKIAHEQEVESLAVVPCRIAGCLEGFITLDVCSGQRERPVWSEAERALVNDLVRVVTQGISQRRAERGLHESKLLLEQTNRELEKRVAARTAELERRHAELLDANRELESLHRAKDEFVAMVSHELRTPLVTGIGYAELLLDGQLGPVSPEAAAGMTVALRNLRRLAGMIDDILSYHSLLRREVRPLTAPPGCDIAALLRECREEFLVRSGRAAGSVRLEVAEGLPPAAADADLLRRAVANLLDNAHRHAGAETAVRIIAAPAPSGGGVRLTVADDGPGIAPEHQGGIFEPFVKLSAASGGTGLGLAVVRSVLEAHGSRPELRSAPGRGTEVAFTLPALRGRQTPPAPGPGETGPTVPAPDGGRTVLVVDDDPDTVKMLGFLLEHGGYRVLTAVNAERAIELLAGSRVDLVLLDMTLPGLSGAGLCARLKGQPVTARLPVIMFSARAEEAARDEARRAGCDGYLVKPLAARDLLAAIGRALGA
jgi:PAS domain S-box-containing protein